MSSAEMSLPEHIIRSLDSYLNMREMVAKSSEGWFTEHDVDEARERLVKAIETAFSK